VYVGTSLGLFKLEKEDVYDEITYYVDVEIKTKKNHQVPDKKQEVKKPTVTPEVQPEPESKRKGFFRFLRRNRTKTPEVVVEKKASPQKQDETPKTEETVAQFQKVKKTERVLRTSQFVYKKVAGIDAKVTQLTAIHKNLLAIGLGGVYQIQDKMSKPILEEPARLAFGSSTQDMLFVATYADEVKSFRITEMGWQSTKTLDNLDDQINSISEGLNHELWFFALTKAYRLEIDGDEVKQLQAVDLINPNYDKISGTMWRNEMIIANTDGHPYSR